MVAITDGNLMIIESRSQIDLRVLSVQCVINPKRVFWSDPNNCVFIDKLQLHGVHTIIDKLFGLRGRVRKIPSIFSLNTRGRLGVICFNNDPVASKVKIFNTAWGCAAYQKSE